MIEVTLDNVKLRSGEAWQPFLAVHGATAYELAVAHGFVGTEEDWNAIVLANGYKLSDDGNGNVELRKVESVL